jgi:uncharacterized protein (TIGR02453 family)
MLQPKTLQFLKSLKTNNNKPWMDSNKDIYTAAKEDWLQFVQEVMNAMAKFEPSFAEMEAKKCVFRQNRDVRFSTNKDPYKTNFGASIKIDGKKSPYAGYYIHCEPGGCFVGGGYYMPDPKVLASIRQEVDYNFADFKKIITNKKFVASYGELSTEQKLVKVPKGYDANNPAAEILKLKSFVAITSVTDKEYCSKEAVKKVVEHLQALKPLLDFLNATVE